MALRPQDIQRKTMEAYLSVVSAPTKSWEKSNFWDGPIRFRSFISRGLRCHRIGDCSADFSYERSGLKPSIPVALEHILNLREKLVYCLPQGNPQKTLLCCFIVGLSVRATPNPKMEAALFVQEKDKMADGTPRRFWVSHSPFKWGRFLRGGDRSFQVVWRTDLQVDWNEH